MIPGKHFSEGMLTPKEIRDGWIEKEKGGTRPIPTHKQDSLWKKENTSEWVNPQIPKRNKGGSWESCNL